MYERCLFALAEFLAVAGVDPTWRTYKKLCKGNPDWPATSLIGRHGEFGLMVGAARHLRETGEILRLGSVKAGAAKHGA